MANALMPHRLDLQNDSLREVIEWNFPMEHLNYTKFKYLSLETEMRNKMWENESKRNFYQQIGSSNSSQVLDQNQNVSNDITHFSNENHASNSNLTSSKPGGKFSSANISQNYTSNGNYQTNSNISTDFSSISLGGSQHMTPSLNLIQTENLIQNGQEYDNILIFKKSNEKDMKRKLITNDSSSVKEELLEMKSIFTKMMAAQTEDLIGFPEPVHLVLKLIKLECNLKEKDATIYNLETTIKKLKQESEKIKDDHEFQLASQQQETKFLKEKIDYKAEIEASLKSRSKETNDKVSVERLNEHIERLKEKIQEMETNNIQSEQKLKQLAHDAAISHQDLENMQEVIKNLQLNEKSHKIEIERYIAIEKEGLERERQDRYLLLVEQNKLKHKVEKLSENCKSYQMKNEELCRIQNELEQECDQFRKLKKMIQDHGLPNHEQLIMLQQQTEMFKDDVLTERKDRERAQAQREKMRRDLEILQSRNQSLQEQVYKYQEHIMRLNTGDRRILQNQEFLQMGHQVTRYKPPSYPAVNSWDLDTEFAGNKGGNKFARQLSSPAYFNPKIRMGTDMASNLLKNSSAVSQDLTSPVLNGRQGSPVNDPSLSRQSSLNGFPNNVRGISRRPQSFSDITDFDQWSQAQGLNQQTRNPTAAINRSPRSPLLGQSNDPWMVPPSNVPSQVRQGGSNEFNYVNNIWSQHAPTLPVIFNGENLNSNNLVRMPSTFNWQLNDNQYPIHPNRINSPYGGQSDRLNSLKNFQGIDTWSTCSDDLNNIGGSRTATPVSNQSDFVIKEDRENHDNGTRISAGFQCGKCSARYHDTEAFRSHVEKCFNNS
ncbi:leucine-rich repeat-containing protein 45 isoform X6 [Hydra vulgaris]|uniref:Leucine-rich repeat-containing protein 45 isoform X6 n=1 Tax=Hydra vulgaris TaxID=6087 RepID=A0ABM4BST0_HYDVU